MTARRAAAPAMAPLAIRTWLDGAPPPGGSVAETAAVVIDVLRATTTVATALANGAPYVAGFAAIDDAFAYRAAREEEGELPLVGGERGGLKIAGFDLGNSPREYNLANVGGRPVVLCTTNGTAAWERCRGAKALYAAAFVNAGATAAALAKTATPVTLCCAGKEGAPSLEDACCAGLVATLLTQAQPYEPDDATAMARLCWERHKKEVVRMLRLCSHGRYLASLGFDEDLVYCGGVNTLPVTGVRGPEDTLVLAG